MTPAGQLAAASDLLGEIEADARPADAVANSFFRNRRFIGAGDRREVSTLTWGVLRARRHLGWWLEHFGAEPTPRLLHGAHHAIGTDGEQTNDRVKRDDGLAQHACAVCGHGGYDVADECGVLRAARRETWCFVAAPDDYVRGAFDFIDFVAVDNFFVAREVDDAGAFGPQFLADGEEHGVAETATDEQRGLVRE